MRGAFNLMKKEDIKKYNKFDDKLKHRAKTIADVNDKGVYSRGIRYQEPTTARGRMIKPNKRLSSAGIRFNQLNLGKKTHTKMRIAPKGLITVKVPIPHEPQEQKHKVVDDEMFNNVLIQSLGENSEIIKALSKV